MKTPSLLGLILLAHLLVVLPLLVWQSARALRAQRAASEDTESAPPLPRGQLFLSTMIMLALLLGLAWLAGRDVYSLFSFNAIGLSEVGFGALALGVSLGLRKLSDVLWTPEERRRLIVRAMLPRTPGEWALYVAMAVLAGIAEEAAYRGVGMYVLRETIGNPWVAALILSTAFALAHLVQEWKAVALVFVMAVLMHALVELTGTLVVAMVVHAVFDIISGVLGACEAREESSTPASGFRAAG